jgi:K+-transporting ATPase KdpF subunit
MNGLYLLGGLLAIGLLIYLITALLFPEDFS